MSLRMLNYITQYVLTFISCLIIWSINIRHRLFIGNYKDRAIVCKFAYHFYTCAMDIFCQKLIKNNSFDVSHNVNTKFVRRVLSMQFQDPQYDLEVLLNILRGMRKWSHDHLNVNIWHRCRTNCPNRSVSTHTLLRIVFPRYICKCIVRFFLSWLHLLFHFSLSR